MGTRVCMQIAIRSMI